MNRLVCEDCGTVYYSAAAKTLVEQGETCAKCGGTLRFVEDAPDHASVSGGPANDDGSD